MDHRERWFQTNPTIGGITGPRHFSDSSKVNQSQKGETALHHGSENFLPRLLPKQARAQRCQMDGVDRS